MNKTAYTSAETLLTLAIIGVETVTALPDTCQKINIINNFNFKNIY